MSSRVLLWLFAFASAAVVLLSCGTIEPATIVDPVRVLLDGLVRDGVLTETQASIVGRLIEQLITRLLA